MNVRNVLFLIILFLVWLAGYYYYSPRPSSQPTVLEIEHSQTEMLWNDQEEEVTSQEQQEAPSTDTQISVPDIQSTTQRPATQPYSEKSQKASPSITKKERKKKSKKTQKKQEPTPVLSPMANIPVTPIAAASLPEEASIEDSKEGSIAVSSSLVKRDIGYYKMLSWHYPYLFNLTVNGQPLFIKHDKKITENEVRIPANQPFIIRYNYEWHTPWGKRIGAKSVTFKPNANAQNLSVAFKSNWKNEERIAVDGATKVSQELLEEETAP